MNTFPRPGSLWVTKPEGWYVRVTEQQDYPSLRVMVIIDPERRRGDVLYTPFPVPIEDLEAPERAQAEL